MWDYIFLQIDVADVYAFLEKALAPIVSLGLQRRYASQARPTTESTPSPCTLTIHTIDICFTPDHTIYPLQVLHPQVLTSAIRVGP